MIHQIIRPRRRPLGRTEINAVFLAHVFDLLPAAREADDGGVELGEVAVQHGGGVPRGVAGDEDGEEGGAWRGGGGSGWWGGGSGRVGGRDGGRRRGDEIDHPRHLVEFFGADVGTVRESEIDLHPPTILVISKTIPSPPPPPKKKKKTSPQTHQREPSPQRPTPKRPPPHINQLKLPAHLRPSHAFTRLGHALALHARFLDAEVGVHAAAGEDEEERCTDGEGPAGAGARAGFLDGAVGAVGGGGW